jgi:hypothetical protein
MCPARSRTGNDRRAKRRVLGSPTEQREVVLDTISFRPRAPRSGRFGSKALAASAIVVAILGLAACTSAPAPATGVQPTPLSVGCHDGVDSGVGDLRYDGPIDMRHNAAYMYSTDGSCSGAVEKILGTVVVADNLADATAKCAVLEPGAPVSLIGPEYGGPPGNWDCFRDLPGLVPGCYDTATPGLPDLYYFNTIDEPNGLKLGLSTDGSCSQDGPLATMVIGDDLAEASAKCNALAPGTTAFDLSTDYGTPQGYYECKP